MKATRHRARAKLLWLAAADARGHLMRAHVLRQAFSRHGIRIEILTTSESGRAFLSALGTPSQLLSGGYSIQFDARQNLRRSGTETAIARYLLSPAGFGRDLSELRRLATGADLVVNDFHPALLVSRTVGAPIVHVHGAHLWHAVAHHFEASPLPALDRAFFRALSALRSRGWGVVEHTLDERAWGSEARHHVVPPVVAVPRLSRAEARARLGVAASEKLAAIYLNPHFRDPALAAALERQLDALGIRFCAVGEGFAARPRWQPYASDFVDVAAAADLIVSAPGMGALALSRTFELPLLALVTDQPEQRKNLEFLRACRAPHVVLELARPEWRAALGAALGRLSSAPRAFACPERAVAAVHQRWLDAFEALLAATQTRKDPHPWLNDRPNYPAPPSCSKPTICTEVPRTRLASGRA